MARTCASYDVRSLSFERGRRRRQFAFTCIAPKRCKYDPNIKGRDNNDHGPSRQWTNFGIAQAVG